MKKVLIINTTLNRGGAARVAYDLFESMGSHFDISYAYGRGKKNRNQKTFYFGNIIESFIHLFFVRFLGLEGYGSYFATKKLINFIKKGKFDLINIHNLHGYYVNFFTLMEYLKESNIPIIYSLHDEWPITWLPAHSLECKHCKTGKGNCTNTYRYPKNYFPLFQNVMLRKKKEMFSGQHMILVCPSLWLKHEIENSFLNAYTIEVIFNSIDTGTFKPVMNKNDLRKKYSFPIDKKIILFAASNLNDVSKGIRYIMSAAKILEDKNYLFIGIGHGTLPQAENFTTFGYIYDKNTLAEMYELSDIFCFASSAETFLLSAAEALSSGIPVVGFDLPVVRELVNSSVGVLTEKHSNTLAQAIDNLLSDENKRHEMGMAGRKLIERDYAKDIFTEKYTVLYNMN